MNLPQGWQENPYAGAGLSERRSPDSIIRSAESGKSLRRLELERQAAKIKNPFDRQAFILENIILPAVN